MNLYERQDLKDFLVPLYGERVKSWHMNEQLFNLTYELVAESGLCSGMMDFVPRTMPYGVSSMRYLAKEIRGIFLRTISQNKKQYIACIKGVAIKMRSQFDEAARGL